MRLLMRLFSSRRTCGLFFVTLPVALLLGLLLAGSSCSSISRNPATGNDPVAAPMAAPMAAPAEAADSEAAPEPEPEPESPSSAGLTEDEILAIPPEVGSETDLLDIGSKSLEELNVDEHLKDVHFEYDSAQLSAAMRATLEENADWLSRYPLSKDPGRGALRRTRHGGIQPGPRGRTRPRRPRLPAGPRRRFRPDADHQLRQGIPS